MLRSRARRCRGWQQRRLRRRGAVGATTVCADIGDDSCVARDNSRLPLSVASWSGTHYNQVRPRNASPACPHTSTTTRRVRHLCARAAHRHRAAFRRAIVEHFCVHRKCTGAGRNANSGVPVAPPREGNVPTGGKCIWPWLRPDGDVRAVSTPRSWRRRAHPEVLPARAESAAAVVSVRLHRLCGPSSHGWWRPLARGGAGRRALVGESGRH